MPEFDCAVIGAGLAGLACTKRLAQLGHRVLLIDRKPTLSAGIHTTGIFVRRSLEDFEFPSDCLGPVIRDVSLYSPGLARLDLKSPHEEFRVGRMARLYSEMLNQCRTAGAVTVLDSSVEAIVSQGEQSQLTLRTGLRSWQAAARFIVGADGASSRVAEHLNLSRNTEWIVGIEDVYRDTARSGVPRMHCLVDPVLAPGYIAWAVHDGQETHVGVGGYPQQFEPAKSLAMWTQLVQEKLGIALHDRIERRGGRIPVGGILPSISNRFGLLVGDAAGAVSPLTAGGLDPCLRLSGFAAQVIDAALRGNCSDPLVGYSGELFRTKFRTRLWMRAALRSIRSRVLIEAGCWCLRTGIGRRVAERVFFQPASFPDTANMEAPRPRLGLAGAGPV